MCSEKEEKKEIKEEEEEDVMTSSLVALLGVIPTMASNPNIQLKLRYNV